MLATPVLLRRRRAGGDPLAAYAIGGISPTMVSDFQNGVYLGSVSSLSDWTFTGILEADGATVDSAGGNVLILPNTKVPTLSPADGFTMAIWGAITYADNDAGVEARIVRIWNGLPEAIYWDLRTSVGTGQIRIQQVAGNVYDTSDSIGSVLSPGTDVPFSIAVRHGPTWVQGAVHGVASAENLTPSAFPNIGNEALEILAIGNVATIGGVIIWPGDLGTAGIMEVSQSGFFT